jgi:hypothetical protein
LCREADHPADPQTLADNDPDPDLHYRSAKLGARLTVNYIKIDDALLDNAHPIIMAANHTADLLTSVVCSFANRAVMIDASFSSVCTLLIRASSVLHRSVLPPSLLSTGINMLATMPLPGRHHLWNLLLVLLGIPTIRYQMLSPRMSLLTLLPPDAWHRGTMNGRRSLLLTLLDVLPMLLMLLPDTITIYRGVHTSLLLLPMHQLLLLLLTRILLLASLPALLS